MKKFAAKLVVMLLVVAMCLSMFAACGEKGDATEIFIGASGPLTGDNATYGISVDNGAKIAIEEINANGGVNGIKLKYRMEDDQADGEKAKTVFNKLLSDGMHMFMGAVTSGASIEAGEISFAENLFQITPSGSAIDCAKYPNQFRICFTDPLQGQVSAKFMKEHFPNVTKVGVLYNKSDEYSTGIYKAFEEATGSALTVEAFTEETKTDFSAQIQSFKSAGCEMVFLPIYAQDAALFLTQAKEKGLSTTYMGCDGLDGILGTIADKADVEGVIYLTPFLASSDDDATKSFVAKYEKEYAFTPDQFAADGYDAIYTIKAAMEKAGVKDAAIDPSDLCDMMKSAMTQIEVDGLTGTTTWTADGEPSKDAMYVIIKNGVAELYE